MTKVKGGHHTQALKEERKSKKHRQRNRLVKSKIKTLCKKVEAAIQDKKVDEAKKIFLDAVKKLDKAAAKKVIPKNKVARKKSQLSRKINAATIKL